MGYNTSFEGKFTFNKPLEFAHYAELKTRYDDDKWNEGRPDTYCQWVVTEDQEALEYDGNEKFYDYVEWLQYLITEFFEPWGYKLNGAVNWSGEDTDDVGEIVVTNNEVVARSLQEIKKDLGDNLDRHAALIMSLISILDDIPKQDSFGDVCNMVSKRREALGI